MNYTRKSAILALAIGSILAASAQGHSARMDGNGAAAATAGAVCLTVQIRNGDESKQMPVFVAADDAPRLSKAGLVAAPCPASFNVEEYQKAICDMAAFGNDGTQASFAKRIGVRPAKLCASVRKATGTPAAPAGDSK